MDELTLIIYEWIEEEINEDEIDESEEVPDFDKFDKDDDE